MQRKKVLALVLALLFVVLMVACSTPSSSQPVSSGGSASQGSSGAGGDENLDPVIGVAPAPSADDPVTFTMFIRDPGQAPVDNDRIKKIQELTGVSIKFEFLVGDLAQKLGVMIAGGDYPDLIFAGDSLGKLIEAQALVPMEDKLQDYPRLWDLVEEGDWLPFMSAEDGHAYSMPTNTVWSNAYVFEAGIGFYIQKAVLAEFGYPIPKTVDEYFTLIKDYMEKYPEIDGMKTMGFEILMDDWRNWPLRAPVAGLMGASNNGEVFVDDTTFEVSSYHINDIAHDYYKRLNQAYHDGIIDPATFTKSHDEYIADMSTGAILGMFDQTWNFNNGQNVLKNDGKYERTYIAVPITAEGYKDGYMDTPKGLPDAVNGVAVTTNCKDVDRVLEYWDWLLQREVQDWMRWGDEGVDWVWAEDGVGKVLTEEGRAVQNDAARRRDETTWAIHTYAPHGNGLYDDGVPTSPDRSADEFLAALSDWDQEFLGHYDARFPAELQSDPVTRPKYFPVWSFVLEDGGTPLLVKNQINDLCVKWYPRMIIAKDDAEFESLWTSFVSEYEALDLETYFGEIERQIAVMEAK